MNFSEKQGQAIKKVVAWYRGGRSTPQIFRLFGFAGAGKTTLAKFIRAELGTGIYGCFTGKAALVLRSKGCADARTLHSLIYKPDEDEETGKVHFEFNPDGPISEAGLLIVDEVSMVGEELGMDCLRYGVKILVLGDPFQLPPIHGEGFFTDREPDVLLDEIHRQAADNPIIRMSMDIRLGRGLQPGEYGDSYVRRRSEMSKDDIQEASMSADQVLCGINKTRNTVNARMRLLKGYDGAIQLPNDLGIKIQVTPGERLVCLKNNKEKGLLNGSLWTVTPKPAIGKPSDPLQALRFHVQSIDEPDRTDQVDVYTHGEFFGGNPKENMDWREVKRYDQFDFGQCLTVHKYQGSQSNIIALFDESRVFKEHQARHLYTGITRAAEQVRVFI